MTFNGAVVGCTPMTAGARGRARWRKDSVATAMLRDCMGRSNEVRKGLNMMLPSRSKFPSLCFVALVSSAKTVPCDKIRILSFVGKKREDGFIAIAFNGT